jgi:hypothetical protein
MTDVFDDTGPLELACAILRFIDDANLSGALGLNPDREALVESIANAIDETVNGPYREDALRLLCGVALRWDEIL